MRKFGVSVSWKMWVAILALVRNKPYPIWSYRTLNIDKPLEKGQVVCYKTNPYAIVV
jgi:hypothetical protein